MNDLICGAIKNKQRIQFVYNGKTRIGEPQCYGRSRTGKEVIRVHLIKGGSRPEQLFELAKAEKLTILDEHFTKPGPNYKKNDGDMTEIFCQL